ncbi:hypothetical protein LX12_003124 [Williamsia serinedens]|uniref:Glycosyl transferase family 2 n=1 Tax=Williamsia serinedens TaxID=391736 RepID=A0ABT1H3W0_9NOCA|nr:hypothetical protein [Williamsia serinedens]
MNSNFKLVCTHLIRKILNRLQCAAWLLVVFAFPFCLIQALIEKRRTSVGEGKAVVCLTTFPRRLPSAVRALKSICLQLDPPDSIVIVLARSQFDRVPLQFERVSRKSHVDVRVVFTESDLRSYKKVFLYGTIGDKNLITVDDDVIYRPDLLTKLREVSRHSPHSVVGTRGYQIERDSTGRVKEYSTWKRAIPMVASADVFLTGVGAILYPPGSLGPSPLDLERACVECPDADDVWLKYRSLQAGQVSVATGETMFEIQPGTQGGALWHRNLTAGANDEHIELFLGRSRPRPNHPLITGRKDE